MQDRRIKSRGSSVSIWLVLGFDSRL